MDVRRTIAELTSQLSEIKYDSDEDNVLLKGHSYNDTYNLSAEENDEIEDVGPSALRRSTDKLKLPDNIYGGKAITRKKSYSLSDTDEESIDNGLDDKSSDQFSEDENSDDEIESKSLVDEDFNETEDLSLKTTKIKTSNNNENGLTNYNIYSFGSKNIANDVKKGFAIRNQFRIWESLLEGKIKLQQALVASNNLPKGESLTKSIYQLDSDNKLKINKCKKNLLALLGKLLDLQKELKKQCSEFGTDKDQKQNEEILSDESEIEDENEEKTEEDNLPPKKKIKLSEYSSLLKNDHSKFIPFRNACIQKWNDKTKVSSGKMAKLNFSAFDQSTLKQIEQIMLDKNKLLNRTRTKRSENQISNRNNEKEVLQKSEEPCMDSEIFDDTDFYHKLLRDYIERKSSDSTNSHTERQLIELHKLRCKMKKNVDTKSTKGRKIRYVALPKLVNFMAQNPYHSWSDEAETELYNSLFGKIKL